MEGLKLSYDYFCKNNIPHKKIGKLIVAQNPAQVKRIDDLYDRGIKNNVPDLQIVEKDCISKYEPKCQVSFEKRMNYIHETIRTDTSKYSARNL